MTTIWQNYWMTIVTAMCVVPLGVVLIRRVRKSEKVKVEE